MEREDMKDASRLLLSEKGMRLGTRWNVDMEVV